MPQTLWPKINTSLKNYNSVTRSNEDQVNYSDDDGDSEQEDGDSDSDSDGHTKQHSTNVHLRKEEDALLWIQKSKKKRVIPTCWNMFLKRH